MFGRRSRRQFSPFARQIGLFSISLRTDRDALARGHRQGTGDETGEASEQHRPFVGVGRRDADYQAAGRNQTIVSA